MGLSWRSFLQLCIPPNQHCHLKTAGAVKEVPRSAQCSQCCHLCSISTSEFLHKENSLHFGARHYFSHRVRPSTCFFFCTMQSDSKNDYHTWNRTTSLHKQVSRFLQFSTHPTNVENFATAHAIVLDKPQLKERFTNKNPSRVNDLRASQFLWSILLQKGQIKLTAQSYPFPLQIWF